MAETIKGINVVIGAETTGLSKALSDVNKRSKDIQSELKQVEKLLKLDPSNTELLVQKQKLLTDAVSNTKEKLDRLKSAQEQVNTQFTKGEISEGQYRAFQREIAAAEQDLEKFEEQLKQTNPKLEAFGVKAKEVGEKLSNTGEKLTKGVTVPLVAAGAGLVAVGDQFDAAFDTIRTGTGATGDALRGLEEDFRAVAEGVPSSFEDISTAIADYNTRLNLSGPALQELATQTLNLSRVTGTDLAANIENTAQSFQAFNVDAADYGELLDYVFKVSQSTGIGIQRLQEDLIKFSPALKQLGLGFAESATLIGFLDKAGVNVEQTLAGLTKAVASMAKEGITDANEAIKTLFDRIKNAPTDLQGTQAALEVFGAKAGPALASAIREGKLEYQDLLAALLGSEETINGVAGETDDWAEGLGGLRNQILLAVEPLAGKFFGAINNLIPLLKKAVEFIAGVVEAFANLPPGVQAAILVIAGIAAVLGPLLVVIGSIVSALPVLGAALGVLLGPVGLVVAAIAALIAIGVLLYKNWDTIKEKLSKIWDGIKETASKVWNAIKDFFKKWGDEILLIAAGPAGWAVLLARALVQNWDTIKQVALTAWTSIKTGISSIWGSIVSSISGAVGNVTNAVKNGLGNAWSYIKSIPSQALQWGKNIIQGLINGIKSLHIPMPHFDFSVNWKSIAGVKFPVPDVDIDWYQKGGIFTSPTVIGVGEAGTEAVIPIDKLEKFLGNGQPVEIILKLDSAVISRQLLYLNQGKLRGAGA